MRGILFFAKLTRHVCSWYSKGDHEAGTTFNYRIILSFANYFSANPSWLSVVLYYYFKPFQVKASILHEVIWLYSLWWLCLKIRFINNVWRGSILVQALSSFKLFRADHLDIMNHCFTWHLNWLKELRLKFRM